MSYLKGTADHGISFRKTPSLNSIGLNDVDWASDRDDRCLTTGFCVYLGRNIVSWLAKKIHVVSRSSTEAKYHSDASAAVELTRIQGLLVALHVSSTKTPIFGVIISAP